MLRGNVVEIQNRQKKAILQGLANFHQAGIGEGITAILGSRVENVFCDEQMDLALACIHISNAGYVRGKPNAKLIATVFSDLYGKHNSTSIFSKKRKRELLKIVQSAITAEFEWVDP